MFLIYRKERLSMEHSALAVGADGELIVGALPSRCSRRTDRRANCKRPSPLATQRSIPHRKAVSSPCGGRQLYRTVVSALSLPWHELCFKCQSFSTRGVPIS